MQQVPFSRSPKLPPVGTVSYATSVPFRWMDGIDVRMGARRADTRSVAGLFSPRQQRAMDKDTAGMAGSIQPIHPSMPSHTTIRRKAAWNVHRLQLLLLLLLLLELSARYLGTIGKVPRTGRQHCAQAGDVDLRASGGPAATGRLGCSARRRQQHLRPPSHPPPLRQPDSGLRWAGRARSTSIAESERARGRASGGTDGGALRRANSWGSSSTRTCLRVQNATHQTRLETHAVSVSRNETGARPSSLSALAPPSPNLAKLFITCVLPRSPSFVRTSHRTTTTTTTTTFHDLCSAGFLNWSTPDCSIHPIPRPFLPPSSLSLVPCPSPAETEASARPPCRTASRARTRITRPPRRSRSRGTSRPTAMARYAAPSAVARAIARNGTAPRKLCNDLTRGFPLLLQANPYAQDQYEMQDYGNQDQYGNQYGHPYGGTQSTQQQQQPQQGAAVLSQAEFLERVTTLRNNIRGLTADIDTISSLHQRTLSSTDGNARAQLNNFVEQTRSRNQAITEEIKALELDVKKTKGPDNTKKPQFESLRTYFKSELDKYHSVERDFEHRYREQIARQYRIVNPDATEDEVQEAAQADWGNEGVFQTAVRAFIPSAAIFPVFVPS